MCVLRIVSKVTELFCRLLFKSEYLYVSQNVYGGALSYCMNGSYFMSRDSKSIERRLQHMQKHKKHPFQSTFPQPTVTNQ